MSHSSSCNNKHISHSQVKVIKRKSKLEESRIYLSQAVLASWHSFSVLLQKAHTKLVRMWQVSHSQPASKSSQGKTNAFLISDPSFCSPHLHSLSSFSRLNQLFLVLMAASSSRQCGRIWPKKLERFSNFARKGLKISGNLCCSSSSFFSHAHHVCRVWWERVQILILLKYHALLSRANDDE